MLRRVEKPDPRKKSVFIPILRYLRGHRQACNMLVRLNVCLHVSSRDVLCSFLLTPMARASLNAAVEIGCPSIVCIGSCVESSVCIICMFVTCSVWLLVSDRQPRHTCEQKRLWQCNCYTVLRKEILRTKKLAAPSLLCYF